jgi:hypothetical protein
MPKNERNVLMTYDKDFRKYLQALEYTNQLIRFWRSVNRYTGLMPFVRPQAALQELERFVCRFFDHLFFLDSRLSAYGAEKFPAKPITIVVPWSAGGHLDLVARKQSRRFMKKT